MKSSNASSGVKSTRTVLRIASTPLSRWSAHPARSFRAALGGEAPERLVPEAVEVRPDPRQPAPDRRGRCAGCRPCVSSTSPASFSTRRCCETAGRLTGMRAANSPTDWGPCLSASKICRRVQSPSASRTIPLVLTYRKYALTDSWLSTAPAVRDRRPPVAAERLRPQLHARRRLAALVLGAVDQGERPVDGRRVVPLGDAAPRASGRARRTPRARGRARRRAAASPRPAGRRAAPPTAAAR